MNYRFDRVLVVAVPECRPASAEAPCATTRKRWFRRPSGRPRPQGDRGYRAAPTDTSRTLGLIGRLTTLLLIGLALSVSSPTSGTAPQLWAQASAPGTRQLPVNVAAFRNQGKLAFMWKGRLYVLDGDRGALRLLASPGQNVDFTWSPDGRWLAYGKAGQLWMVRADGGDVHVMTGLPGSVGGYVWSPVADVIVVVANATGKQAPGVWLASPTGRPRRTTLPWIGTWSPGGRRMAYVITLPYRHPETRSDALYTAPISGGARTRRYLARSSGIILAGWWPDGKGLLFWLDPYHSQSLAADGLQLFSVPLGGPARPLTTALAYWLSWSPSGREVLLVPGAGRTVWHGKSLARCDVRTAQCRVLPHPTGVVELDPDWAPQGNSIAFVEARDRGNNGGFLTNKALLAWVHTHTLWVMDARGQGAHRLIAAGTGTYAPQWSRDGLHLLYIRDNALWMIRIDGGAPARILGPFPKAADYFGFYGQPSFSFSFAWHEG